MKTMFAAVALILLALAACGGDTNQSAGGNAVPTNSPAATGAAPEDSSRDVGADQAKHWLRISARRSDTGFEFYVDDSNSPSSLEELSARLSDYASRKDAAAKLDGFDTEGISGNPVRFIAAPDVSSLAYWVALETLVGSRLVRMHTELLLPDGSLSAWVELPRDEGLGRQPGPELVGTDVKVVEDAGRINYLVRGDEGEREPLENGSFNTSDLGESATTAKITLLRDAFVKSFGKRETAAGVVLDEVEIAPTAELFPGRKDFAPWGAVFIAIDGLHQIEKQRTTKRKLMTKFKYTDAKGAMDRD